MSLRCENNEYSDTKEKCSAKVCVEFGDHSSGSVGASKITRNSVKISREDEVV